jgi:hypothetical protein
MAIPMIIEVHCYNFTMLYRKSYYLKVNYVNFMFHTLIFRTITKVAKSMVKRSREDIEKNSKRYDLNPKNDKL